MASPRFRRRPEHGVALVEFALLVPFICILVLGTVDLGRAFALKNRLKNAAREGAAFAQYFPGQVANTTGTCASPNNITWKSLNEDSLSPATTSVVVTDTTTGTNLTGCATDPSPYTGHRIKVSVERDFTVITPFVGDLIGGNTKRARGTAEVLVPG